MCDRPKPDGDRGWSKQGRQSLELCLGQPRLNLRQSRLNLRQRGLWHRFPSMPWGMLGLLGWGRILCPLLSGG